MANPVTVDPQIMGGIPCFAGTRVPAKSLFDHLKLGYTIEGFLKQFPTIHREQVDALLDISKQQIGIALTLQPVASESR